MILRIELTILSEVRRDVSFDLMSVSSGMVPSMTLLAWSSIYGTKAKPQEALNVSIESSVAFKPAPKNVGLELFWA